MGFHFFPPDLIPDIDHLDLRHLHVTVAFHHLDQRILSFLAIEITLDGRCCRTDDRLGAVQMSQVQISSSVTSLPQSQNTLMPRFSSMPNTARLKTTLGKMLYKLRKQTVEPVFGIIKEAKVR